MVLCDIFIQGKRVKRGQNNGLISMNGETLAYIGLSIAIE